MLNPQNKNAERIDKVDKGIDKTLDYSDIKFPIKEKQYSFIEKRLNMNVNVFKYDKGVIPFYNSKLNNNQILNLLLIKNENNAHYVFIKDFNQLMYSKTKHTARKYFCMNCLQYTYNFSTQEVLNKHKETCLLLNDNITPLFEKGIIKFNNYDRQLSIPFKIYADIECYNKEINIQKGKSTKLYSKHIPNSIGAKLVCIDNKYTQLTKIFEAKRCINQFLKWIFKTKTLCNNIIRNKFNKDLTMTNEDEEKYNTTNICWICKENILDNKVRDHCHITGKYRGAAHKKCNLKLVISKKLPILFHNLEGYDGHTIFKELNNFNNINIEVIPKSTGK